MGGDRFVVGHPAGAAVAETHSAVVFFVGERAYKLKKPVNLGFLDFRSRQVRSDVCRREVELNRRLAPDVYLGVADVLDPSGELCDHLVVMRRMPPERRLSALVEAGVGVDDHLRELAQVIATFHGQAERSPAADEAAGVDAVAERWAANTAELIEHGDGLLDDDEVARLQHRAERYLAGRRPLFDRRIAEQRACDGHGDLLADDVFCLDDGPRVLDCIEFDDRLRYGDVLADVAFLAMDLERLGRPDLGTRFLAAYKEHTGDTWPASLAHHHVAYRAQVRAKVYAIRAGQGDEPSAAEAPRLLAMAGRHLEAGRVRLVVVGGLPGTGKSTLAAGLGEALEATVLRSDEIRKELAGPSGATPAPAAFGEGIYGQESTAATYEEMIGRAGVALGLGETVVLDASWTDAEWREKARSLAADAHADLVELRCSAPADLAAARIGRRAAAGGDPSDATADIAAALAAVEAPWPSATPVDTSGAVDAALAEALEAVGEAGR